MIKIAVLALVLGALAVSALAQTGMMMGMGGPGGPPPSGCILVAVGNKLDASASNCILIM